MPPLRILAGPLLAVLMAGKAAAEDASLAAGLIGPGLIGAALLAASEHEPEAASQSHLVIVDYSRHSSQERVFVLNRVTGMVTALRAAHGLGSDPDHDGYLDSFSSRPGSQASPDGLFRMAEEYTGRHGRSVRLDGLEGHNHTARARAIVIHAAAYAEPAHLARYGRLGRSNGCLVFSAEDLARFLAEVPRGTLIYIGR